MPTLSIPLPNILIDDADPVDLTTLPEAEAIARIKGIYAFLSAEVEVTIHRGVATITLPDAKASKAGQALAKIEQATRAAQSGHFRQAARTYEEALQVLPDHTAARRNLAMCLYEMGSYPAAKQHLIRVLQLDPRDADAFLVLGNLYYQAEGDYGSAERYYAGALELEPDNPYVLNSYAGLKNKRKQHAEAMLLFEHAIDLLPTYPNPRYGLALCLMERGDIDAALDTLDGLFATPASSDSRHVPVYSEARRLYLRLREIRARAAETSVLAQAQELLDAYNAATDIPIRITENAQLDTNAKVELAWRYQRPYHVIVTKGKPSPYLLMHQLESIWLSDERRASGRSLLFGVSSEVVEQEVRGMARDLRRLLNRMGASADVAADYGRMVVQGLLNQLYNAPSELVIHSRLHGRYPWLRDHQFVWMHGELREYLRTVTDRKLRETSPQPIWEANVAMISAAALFMDDLFSGATAFAAEYAPGGMLETGRRLYALYQAQAADYTPGDEVGIVDAWAQELGLAGQYEWVEDTDEMPAPPAGKAHTRPTGEADGPTHSEFFQDPMAQMAAAMYMVDALERFETMTHEEITQVAAEIALLGITGIDYTSKERQYTLRFLPDESFTGLQLLSLQYVGFQRVWPDMETGIPLEEAYKSAVAMHEMKRGKQDS